MGKADSTSPLWLDKFFDETMDLLLEAKNYHANVVKRQVRHLVPLTQLEITKESLRITSRLSHTMAWLIYEKAILKNEITRDEFQEDNRPLSEEKVSLARSHTADIEDCPRGLISLMERSFDHFKRATRLEAMLRKE